MAQRETLYDLYPGAMDNEEQAKADKKLYVKFIMDAVPDQLPTEGGYIDIDFFDEERKKELEALGCKFRPVPKEPSLLRIVPCGRPIFKDVELVRIQKPGDRDNIVIRVATDVDRERFPVQYRNFKEGEAEALVGTPLTMVNFVNPARREEFAFFGIRTVEQLAEIPDGVGQKFMGINTLREKAKAFLNAANAERPMTEMQEELKVRDTVIEEQAQTIKALEQRLLALEDDSRSRRRKE